MDEPANHSVVESEDEADVILAHLIAERVDPSRPRLAVHEIALLRLAALILASGDTGKAREVSDLLERGPRIVSPGRRPELSLAQVCRDNAERDITRLSNAQLLQLEELDAIMAGRAMPVVSERQEAALTLTWLLDSEAKPEVARVRELILAVLRPVLAVENVFPSHLAELEAERSHRRALEDEVKRLAHALERAAQPLPANVASLAAARAEREAPIVRATVDAG